jgi:hypothetical protein
MKEKLIQEILNLVKNTRKDFINDITNPFITNIYYIDPVYGTRKIYLMDIVDIDIYQIITVKNLNLGDDYRSIINKTEIIRILNLVSLLDLQYILLLLKKFL